MTPARLREILQLLHWSRRLLARLLGIGETTVRHWEARGSIPEPVAEWLERVVMPLEVYPLPLSWVVQKRERGRPPEAAGTKILSGARNSC